MRLTLLLALLALAGCATTVPGAARPDCDPLRPAGTPCRAVVTTDARLQAQADSVLALPASAVTTAGLVLVQRAHADRLAYVEARAVKGDRQSTGVIVYLVGAAAVGALVVSLLSGGP